MLNARVPPFDLPKKGSDMEKTRPIYKNLLIAAIAIFVIGTAFALSDIYQKIGNIEHSSVGCSHGVKAAK